MAFKKKPKYDPNTKFLANPSMMPQVFTKRVRKCPLDEMQSDEISYKNIDLLKKYLSERGKILPRRITNVSSKRQRELAQAIKHARFLALIPYVDHESTNNFNH